MLFRFKWRTVSVPLPWCAHQAPQVSDRSDPTSSCTSALTAERRKGQIMKYNPAETGRRIKELRRENGITQEDLAMYGNVRKEICGRISRIVQLSGMTARDYDNILDNPSLSPLRTLEKEVGCPLFFRHKGIFPEICS